MGSFLFAYIYIHHLAFFPKLSRDLTLLSFDFAPCQVTDRSVSCSWGCFDFTLHILSSQINKAQVCENWIILHLEMKITVSKVHKYTDSILSTILFVCLFSKGLSCGVEWTGLQKDIGGGIDGKPTLWRTGFCRDRFFFLNNYLVLILFSFPFVSTPCYYAVPLFVQNSHFVCVGRRWIYGSSHRQVIRFSESGAFLQLRPI